MRKRLALLGIMSAVSLWAQVPASCPATSRPSRPFDPPVAIPGSWPDDSFYFGTNDLWTRIPASGWSGLPRWDEGLRQKIVWWTRDYTWRKDPSPRLTISGRRLDGFSVPLIFTGANGSWTENLGSFIMSGVLFPTSGCWEITGRLNFHQLTFVISVGP